MNKYFFHCNGGIFACNHKGIGFIYVVIRGVTCIPLLVTHFPHPLSVLNGCFLRQPSSSTLSNSCYLLRQHPASLLQSLLHHLSSLEVHTHYSFSMYSIIPYLRLYHIPCCPVTPDSASLQPLQTVLPYRVELGVIV